MEGVKPCPNKLKDIMNIQAPKNISEVRSLLGMMNFCGSRFIPDYATLTSEIRNLTQKNKVFEWKENHEKALKHLKEKLQESVHQSYFDPSKETQVYVDASPVGISAILTQSINNQLAQVVQFASRALTPTEQRYSQTEREALAVTWACEHFHIYLYGSPSFKIYTDHKPLVTLFGRPKGQLPARVERWVMRCQGYNMNIIFKPGKDNPADYMSRHPAQQQACSREEKIAEEYIQYLTDNSIPKAMSLQQVQEETRKDNTLQAVLSAVRTGQRYKHATTVLSEHQKMFETLKQCAHQLTTTQDGLLLKSRKIVIPHSLQEQAVHLAHCGHQGQTKTLALLQEKVWFYGMSAAVERTVKNCLACQVATPTSAREPLQMSVLPSKPWTELSADFGHLPNGKQLLVVTYEYSRYVVVDILTVHQREQLSLASTEFFLNLACQNK